MYLSVKKKKNQVKPQYYAFRWITLLLTQEFNFQSIMRIWDSLLANPFGVQVSLTRFFRENDRKCVCLESMTKTLLSHAMNTYLLHMQDMLLRLCCAMLLCIKSRLLSGDFMDNLKLLQHYPEINIEHLIQVALDLTPDTSSYHMPP